MIVGPTAWTWRSVGHSREHHAVLGFRRRHIYSWIHCKSNPKTRQSARKPAGETINRGSCCRLLRILDLRYSATELVSSNYWILLMRRHKRCRYKLGDFDLDLARKWHCAGQTDSYRIRRGSTKWSLPFALCLINELFTNRLHKPTIFSSGSISVAMTRNYSLFLN